MQFGLKDEQEDLRRTVRKFLDDVAPLESVHTSSPQNGARPGVWARMAELGLPGLTIAAHLGGQGAGPVELVVVMAELGRVLAGEPVLSTVYAAEVLGRCQGPVASEWLTRIAAGSCIATVAPSVAAQDDRLTGEASWVVDGASADLIVVGRHLAQADSPGLVRTPLPVLDGTRALATLSFSDVVAEPLTGADLPRAADTGLLALAAEQIGGARACLRMAVDHATTRHAFGRPIGSFQAIKHKCATLHLEIEAAWASLLHAAWTASVDGPDLPLLAATAAASASEVFVHAATENIQIHGGIGFTWEHPAHLYLRRARSSYELFGSPRFHRERAAALIGM
ncbi:acyl-CoA dehydrogenase [Pseudonocardia sulfidoxydans NBRC 16205]|uniref:Acyl-CoA dehydrogenase n=1 Tax=Pseudonocardia sulfidoxydans NBRC 16205 TaxID=1223511 RepID=A0A511DE66_9PSEU|nr:acyl-CoA dehydrogenase family protein [Pseudonocardia sulfidoxydans]GEL23061.1 acyl-CoA dehydrogenase [Pseudonocardia sulfidoxydans NBRC 16205]